MYKAIVSWLFLFLLSSCQGSQQGETTEQKAGQTSFCFRTAFPAEALPDRQDITELQWDVAEDGSITGIYYWLPVEKDSRKGTIKGQMVPEKIDGYVVHATYTYQQEGVETQEKINIIVREDQAVVLPEGESVWVNGVAYPHDFTLSDTLQRTDCSQIKAPSGL